MTLTRRGAGLWQVVLISLWLGATVLFAAAVAPAAFAALPTRTLAGDLVGRVLPVVFWSGMVLFAAVVLLGVRADARSRLKPRILAAALGGASCMIAQLVVDSWIERVRARIHGPVDALAVTDPLRIAFGQLHALSVVLLGVAMVCAAVVLGIAVRDLHSAP